MDEERRRHEREGATDDAEALVRAALAHRRSGELESAREALARAVELAPRHELARALLLVTDIALGRRPHGSFHSAQQNDVDLVRFLEPSSLDAVALSAIDPAHGPVDATAIAHLIGSGREGALAVLRSLGTGAQPSRDVIDTIGQLHSRAVAAAGLSREDVPDALRRYLLAVVGDESLCGCTVLAGALQLAEARPQLEDLLSAYSKKALRNAAVISLELLADPRSRPALEAALSRATSAAEKLLLDRALSALA